MAWSPNWPNGLDAYGSFPGQPYTDGTEFILAAYADSWVLALATLEAYIGYGVGAASPINSPIYGSFGTIAARIYGLEQVVQSNTNNLLTVTPIGGIIEWGDDVSAPTNYLYLHGQTVSGGVASYPTLAARYPSWVSGGDLIMPDSRNRSSIGAGGTYSAGQTAGSATATLNSSQIPLFNNVPVTVSITDPQHSHISQSPASGFVVDFEPSTLYSNFGSNIDHSPALNITVQSATAPASTGITASGSVTFGSVSPATVPTLGPVIAFHKIVRAL